MRTEPDEVGTLGCVGPQDGGASLRLCVGPDVKPAAINLSPLVLCEYLHSVTPNMESGCING